MSKMSFFRVLYFLLPLVIPGQVWAQNNITFRASVEKNRILIGEPLLLKVEAVFPGNSGLQIILPDSIAHFEYPKQLVSDSTNNGGVTTIRAMYELTSFDSGHWVIPSFVLKNGMKTDSLPVDVVFSDFDPSQDYHDIKDIIDVKPKKKNNWWWYAAGGAAAVAALLLYVLRKKKPVPAAKTEVTINAYEEAMKQLEELSRVKTDSKQFHTKLVDIFRLYIFRKKEILSLQKTTDDLVLQLKNLGMEKAQFEKLSQALRLSDFVKFAKYNPSTEDNQHCYNDILNSIKTIEQSGSRSPTMGGS